MKPAQYSFAEGIPFTDYRFKPGGGYQESPRCVITPQEMGDIHRELRSLNTGRILKELRDSQMVTVTDPSSWRNRTYEMRYARFNRDAPEENGEMWVINGWGSDIRMPILQRLMAAYAVAMPKQRMNVINPPNRGDSSRLPLKRALDLKDSYWPMGELVAGAIRTLSPDHDNKPIKMLCESEGVRIGVAAMRALNVSEAHLVDGPGFIGQSLPGISIAMVIKEARHARRYAEQSADSIGQELFMRRSTAGYRTGEALNKFRNGTVLSHYFLQPNGLRQKFMADLKLAVPNISESLRVISLEQSEITNHYLMHSTLGKIAATPSGNRPENVSHRIGRDLSHTHGNANVAQKAILYLSQARV